MSSSKAKKPLKEIVSPVSAAFADYFGLGSISPLLPFFVMEFNPGSQEPLGWILSFQYFGVVLGSTLAGMFSDRIGRRNTLLIALTGDVVFFTMTGWVTSINSMMAVRFFAGLFTPLTACIAWLLDAAGDDTGIRARNQGMFGMCSVVGFMSGAAMGGFAGYSAFEIVNCVCGGLAAFAFVNTIMAKEPERPNADSKPSGVKEISRSPEFLALAVVYLVVGLQFTGATSLLGVVLPEKFGFVEWQVAMAFMLMTVMHFLLMANLRGLTAKFGTPTLIISSYSLAIIGHIFFLFKFSFSSPYSTCFLFLISTLVLPLAMTGANMLAPGLADKYGKNARGATVGMLRTLFNVGQAIGPAYAVSLYNVKNDLNDGFIFFAIQGLCMLAATLIFTWVWVIRKGKDKDADWGEREKVGMQLVKVETTAEEDDL